MPFDQSSIATLSDMGLTALLLIAIGVIWMEWRKAEKGRLEDARRNAEQMMVVSKDFTEAIHKSADAQQKAIEMLKARLPN